jgi:hypothetical protein
LSYKYVLSTKYVLGFIFIIFKYSLKIEVKNVLVTILLATWPSVLNFKKKKKKKKKGVKEN